MQISNRRKFLPLQVCNWSHVLLCSKNQLVMQSSSKQSDWVGPSCSKQGVQIYLLHKHHEEADVRLEQSVLCLFGHRQFSISSIHVYMCAWVCTAPNWIKSGENNTNKMQQKTTQTKYNRLCCEKTFVQVPKTHPDGQSGSQYFFQSQLWKAWKAEPYPSRTVCNAIFRHQTCTLSSAVNACTKHKPVPPLSMWFVQVHYTSLLTCVGRLSLSLISFICNHLVKSLHWRTDRQSDFTGSKCSWQTNWDRELYAMIQELNRLQRSQTTGVLHTSWFKMAKTCDVSMCVKWT